MEKRIIFGEHNIPAGTAQTLEAARGFASPFLPGLADAEGFVNGDGNFEFRKKAGTKGL
jgi:hypothetical protein